MKGLQFWGAPLLSAAILLIFLAAWHALWDDAEAFYFTEVRPPSAFDLVVSIAE